MEFRRVGANSATSLLSSVRRTQVQNGKESSSIALMIALIFSTSSREDRPIRVSEFSSAQLQFDTNSPSGIH
jgi:hypothetical protein